jgi:hypothetical protein
LGQEKQQQAKKERKENIRKKENSSQVSDHNLFPIFIFDFLSLFIFFCFAGDISYFLIELCLLFGSFMKGKKKFNISIF